MFFWFAGGALVAVWFVFADPAMDQRLVLVGALLPIGVDAVTPAAAPAHMLLFPVALLMVVMLATVGRRAARRRYLGLAIGCFLHLVLDGAWLNRDLFWWPSFGFDQPSTGFGGWDRSWQLVGAMEAAGLVALGWFWWRFGLGDPGRRTRMLRTGRVDPRIARSDPGTC